jgi:hypothetical protein
MAKKQMTERSYVPTSGRLKLKGHSIRKQIVMNVVGAVSRISGQHIEPRQKVRHVVDDNELAGENSIRKLPESEYEDEIGDKVEETNVTAPQDTSPDTEKYNEKEDRLFIFPPPSYRKRDRQLRVLMSRYVFYHRSAPT